MRSMLKPITNVSVDMMTSGMEIFTRLPGIDSHAAMTVAEISVAGMRSLNEFDMHDILDRVDCLNILNYQVIVSSFLRYFRLRECLGRYSKGKAAFVLGIPNLDDSRQFITLAEELDQVASYLAVAQARSGDCIVYRLDIDADVGQWLIPPLIVQPLVENAVKHGLSGKDQGESIRIQAKPVDGFLRVAVKDNGVGMPAGTIEAVFRKSEAEPEDSNIGLRNVFRRLEHIYGPGARLQIRSRRAEGTTITLNLPRAGFTDTA